jgi:hypothetical protein
MERGVGRDALNALGLKIRDTDDFYGAMRVRLTNNNGKLETQWGSSDRMMAGWPKPRSSMPAAANIKEGRMNGDGSNFVVTYVALAE